MEPGGCSAARARSARLRSAGVDRQGVDAARHQGLQGIIYEAMPGDPAKAAVAIITAVESPEPPSFLLLGLDALDGFTAAREAQQAVVDAWRETSRSTSYTG